MQTTHLLSPSTDLSGCPPPVLQFSAQTSWFLQLKLSQMTCPSLGRSGFPFLKSTSSIQLSNKDKSSIRSVLLTKPFWKICSSEDKQFNISLRWTKWLTHLVKHFMKLVIDVKIPSNIRAFGEQGKAIDSKTQLNPKMFKRVKHF